jgi:hypothetical protein
MGLELINPFREGGVVETVEELGNSTSREERYKDINP